MRFSSKALAGCKQNFPMEAQNLQKRKVTNSNQTVSNQCRFAAQDIDVYGVSQKMFSVFSHECRDIFKCERFILVIVAAALNHRPANSPKCP